MVLSFGLYKVCIWAEKEQQKVNLFVIAETERMAYLSCLQLAPEHRQYRVSFLRERRKGEQPGVVRCVTGGRERKIIGEKDGIWKIKNYV